MSIVSSRFLKGIIPRIVTQNTLRQNCSSNNPISYNLKNKVAIVTASTDGIGFSIASRLAQSGASVIVSSRKQTNVDKAVEEITQLNGVNDGQVSGIVCHVGKGEDRKNLVNFAIEKYGSIDILVSNAAVNPAIGPILDTEESVFDKIMDINVKAAFMLTKEVFPHLEKKKSGSIVYISSIAGYQIMPMIATYSVSKTALLGLTKAVATQGGSIGIRANVVCPGIIKTRFSGTIPDTFQDEFCTQVPMGRIGKPEEIGGLVTFLCSDDASYITGESFVASGGYFTRL